MIIGTPWNMDGYFSFDWKQHWHKCYALFPTLTDYGEYVWLEHYWRRRVWSPTMQSYNWERLTEEDYLSKTTYGVSPDWMPEKFRRSK